MKEKIIYQPEDIEALLAEKTFSELYAEERKFVLEHLASPGEYERMRETLLSLRGGTGGGRDQLVPGEHVRERLMKEFEQKKRRGAIIWWNGILIGMRDTLRFDLPVVRYSAAVLLLIVGSFIWFSQNGTPEKDRTAFVHHDSVHAPSSEPKQNLIAVSVDSQPKAVDHAQPVQHKITVPRTPKMIVHQQPKSSQVPKDVQRDNGASAHSADSLLAIHDVPSSGNSIQINPSDSFPAVSADGVTVNASTMTYAWQPSSGTQINNATVASGTYTVTVTDANASTASLCIGANSTVFMNGGTPTLNYSWSNANGTLIPQSRSLSQDANAIRLFFELK